jgi:tetratricopeptide (TPR) repeat protein
MLGRGALTACWLGLALVAAAGCAAILESEGVSDTARHHDVIGRKFLETNELDRAQEAFERARGLEPSFAPAWEGLGLVALARKDVAAAEEAFKTAKGHDWRYVPAYLGLARVYAATGDLDRARAEAEEARRLAPRDARVHLLLGEVLLAAFEFTRAEASFSRALELEPTNAAARRAWDRSVKIRQAAPGTIVGKRIALADPITRGELAALLASELDIEKHLRRRRPELFDPAFRPPGQPAPAAAGPATPTDVHTHWARNAIELVMRLSLMDAYPDGAFRPNEPVTRAGFATTLEQVLSVTVNDAAIRTRHLGQPSPFPDLRSDHFAFNAAVVVTTRGLMEAERPSGAFRLASPVSGPDALLAMRKLAELF